MAQLAKSLLAAIIIVQIRVFLSRVRIYRVPKKEMAELKAAGKARLIYRYYL